MKITNKFDKAFQSAKKSAKEQMHGRTAAKAKKLYADKPFTSEWRGVYILARIISPIAQIVSFLTAVAILKVLLSPIIAADGWAAWSAATAVALCFEVGKSIVSKIGFKQAFRYKQYGGLVVFVMFTGFSIALAYFGSKELPALLIPEKAENTAAGQLDSVQALYAERITAAQGAAEAYKAANSTRSGKVYYDMREQYAKVVQRVQDIQKQRDAAIADVQSQSQAKSEQSAKDLLAKRESASMYILVLSLFFELLFFACAFWIAFYLYRAYIDTHEQYESSEGVLNSGIQTIGESKPERAPIGFRLPEKGTGIEAGDHGHGRGCLHCGTDISDKRSDAKYCSKDCRWAYHRAKQEGS